MTTQAQALAVNAATLKQLHGIPKRLGREFSGLFKHWTNVQVGDVSKNFRGRPGLNHGPGTFHPSGTLLKSIKSRTVASDDLNKVTSEAYSAGTAAFTKTGQDYSRVQEFGATIKAKRAKYLVFQIDGKWFAKKQVVIPPRLRFYDSFRARAQERRTQLVSAAVKAINRKA